MFGNGLWFPNRNSGYFNLWRPRKRDFGENENSLCIVLPCRECKGRILMGMFKIDVTVSNLKDLGRSFMGKFWMDE